MAVCLQINQQNIEGPITIIIIIIIIIIIYN